MTEIMPVPRNSHITVLQPPSIIGPFFAPEKTNKCLTQDCSYDMIKKKNVCSIFERGAPACVAVIHW